MATPEGMVRKLLDRGVAGRGVGETRFKNKEAQKLLAGSMTHQKTVRGHHLPIYCLAFDRTGRWLITGSDDHLVKVRCNTLSLRSMYQVEFQVLWGSWVGCGLQIWSMQTAMLQMACRGHTAEITDLAVSCDNLMLASSSNDHTIRIWDLSVRLLQVLTQNTVDSIKKMWSVDLDCLERALRTVWRAPMTTSLQDDCVGYPVSALLGHTFVVSFIDFHPTVPEILLSSSLDGTCRIWNAWHGGAAVHVLKAEAEFGPARPLLHGFVFTRSDADVAAEASATVTLASSGNTPIRSAERVSSTDLCCIAWRSLLQAKPADSFLQIEILSLFEMTSLWPRSVPVTDPLNMVWSDFVSQEGTEQCCACCADSAGGLLFQSRRHLHCGGSQRLRLLHVDVGGFRLWLAQELPAINNQLQNDAHAERHGVLEGVARPRGAVPPAWPQERRSATPIQQRRQCFCDWLQRWDSAGELS